MFKGSLPIGKIFGISIRLHYSWFIIFALITWALAANYFPAVHPTWSLTLKIGAGLITSLLFFGSVLLHELMHSLVALKEGIPIQSITLFILGGVSQMTSEPGSAKDEFRMAGAGPLSSLILGGIFFGIYFGLKGYSNEAAQFAAAIAYYLGLINVALGIFNLIPGFPLDGGRVLRSLIWWRNGNLKKATRISSNIGRVVGFILIFGGIWLIFTGNFFNGIWLALIGWFLESAALGSYRQMLVQDLLKGHTASDAMSRECTIVRPDISVDHLVNEIVLKTGRRCFPISSGSRVEGMITMDNVRSVPRDKWNSTTVRDAMTPMDKLKTVKPDEDLITVLQIMSQNDINQVPVIENNKVVGMVGRDNLINFMNTMAEINK